MAIGGLDLYANSQEKRFVVYCYSSCFYIQNITRKEAEERIATAKEELNILMQLFTELHDQAQGMNLTFEFLYDDGRDAVLVAKEDHGRFEYLPDAT